MAAMLDSSLPINYQVLTLLVEGELKPGQIADTVGISLNEFYLLRREVRQQIEFTTWALNNAWRQPDGTYLEPDKTLRQRREAWLKAQGRQDPENL